MKLVRSNTVIYATAKYGDNFTTGHFVLVREGCKIGDNVSVGSFTDIEDHVLIGDNVRIHSRCFIPAMTVIEANAWIGPGVIFCNDKYPNTTGKRRGVIVKQKAVIGAGAVILDGVTIGNGAMVGAGSVVTKDVPEGATVVGNPARILRDETP